METSEISKYEEINRKYQEMKRECKKDDEKLEKLKKEVQKLQIENADFKLKIAEYKEAKKTEMERFDKFSQKYKKLFIIKENYSRLLNLCISYENEMKRVPISNETFPKTTEEFEETSKLKCEELQTKIAKNFEIYQKIFKNLEKVNKDLEENMEN